MKLERHGVAWGFLFAISLAFSGCGGSDTSSDQSALYAQQLVDLSNRLTQGQVSGEVALTEFANVMTTIDSAPNGPQLFAKYLNNVVLGPGVSGYTAAAQIRTQSTLDTISNSQAYLAFKTFIQTVFEALAGSAIPEPSATLLSAAHPDVVKACLYLDYYKEIFNTICTTSNVDACQTALSMYASDPAAALAYAYQAAGQPLPSYICTYTISPSSQSFDQNGTNGGSASVTVQTNSGCRWQASSNDSWITVDTAVHTGTDTVSYQVGGPNPNTTSVQGTMTVAGQTFTVTEAGAAQGVTGTWTGPESIPDLGYAGCSATTITGTFVLTEDSSMQITGSINGSTTTFSGSRSGDVVTINESTRYGGRGPYTWTWDGANTLTGSVAWFCFDLANGNLWNEGSATFSMTR